jgi:predicted exporter
MAVITAPDRERALQAAERAGAPLRRLVEEGRIGGFDTPARFLPSEAMQNARRASLPTPEELDARLRTALVDAPISADRLKPFLDDVRAAKASANLTRQDLDGTGLGLVVDALLLQRPQGWSVLLPLRPAPGLDIPVEEVRVALAGSGALFVDLKGEFDTLYGDYIQEAIVLSLAGFAAIVVVLGFVLRSPARLLGVMLPLVMAVMVVVAGLHVSGVRLHLLHLVGLLLTVAVGSNYALFFDRVALGETLDDETLLSIGVASATTAIGFGVLAWSSVPVLHALGVTVGPGAVLALVLSAAFAARKRAL